jgi:AbrB family looped-hinge helix DNA binding protein
MAALKILVSMNAQGRITVPADARELLHVGPDTQFEMEVNEHEMILRPAVVIRREDAWAYTPEHLASVRRALQQVEEGRLRPASTDELGHDDSDGAEAPRRGALVEAAG